MKMDIYPALNKNVTKCKQNVSKNFFPFFGSKMIKENESNFFYQFKFCL